MAMEFPEMLKVSRQLDQVLSGKKFIDITLNDSSASLIKWGFVNLHQCDVVGLKIKQVINHGQYAIVKMENGYNLIFGDLIGRILYHPNKSRLPSKYMILFSLSDKSSISFHTDMYGFAYAMTDKDLYHHRYINLKGIDPLDSSFTFTYFEKMLKNNQKKLVKKIQNLYDYMTGFQNGYFQDIFLCAGILPFKKISKLTLEERTKLYECILQIVQQAVEQGGSKDETDIYNQPGSYKRIFGGHIKNSLCPRCGGVITSKKILGSMSYFCMDCQH